MGKRIEVDCNDCKHINITEDEQNEVYVTVDFRPVHVCRRHNKQIRHIKNGGYNRHPHLEPFVLCGGMDFKERTVNDG